MLFDNTKTEAVQRKSKRPPWHLLSKLYRRTLYSCPSFACIRHYFPRRGRQTETTQMRVTGISPLRGSLRAAPIACVCGWTGVSDPDEVIAKQLVLLFCGRMGTARRLNGLFYAENRTGGSWRILQSRFALVGRFARERISVAGYDRAGPVFVKVRGVGRENPLTTYPDS